MTQRLAFNRSWNTAPGLVVANVALWLMACDASPPLTMRGSTPCPPGTGSVESWCDDAGNCEFRVTTGGVFICRAGDVAGCTAAATDAAESCRAGVVGDGGVGDGGPDPTGGVTVTYIVNTADIPEPDFTSGRVPGFNLDGEDSTGTSERCDDTPDFVSSVTGARGVDNQIGGNVIGLLGEMFGPDGVQGAFREQIAAGSFLLLFEVADIDSFNDDASVRVRLLLGAFDGTIMLDRSGLVAPGQTFTSMRVLATIPVAAISGGRLDIEAPSLPLTLEVNGSAITLNLTQARLGGTISATGMTDGEIGGEISMANLVNLGEALDPVTFTEDLLRSIALPDLDPSPDGTRCDAVSAGLTFRATTATNIP